MALYFMTYNFIRPHKTLNGQTPAMAAGVELWPWTHEDFVKRLLT